MDPAAQSSTSALSAVILLPALVCIVALCLAPPARVFRNIVLPVVIVCPLYFHWKSPLLPPIDFAQAVFWPLGIAMVLRGFSRWRFSWIDLWVLLFSLSAGGADATHSHLNNGIVEMFIGIGACAIPYMAGKLLIEQDGGRVPFIERAVDLLAAVAVVSLYEWRAASNPFHRAFNLVFCDQIVPWATQLRGGHGRVAGPYGSAELAGMMLFFALLLAIFLARFHGWPPARLGLRCASPLWPPGSSSSLYTLPSLADRSSAFCLPRPSPGLAAPATSRATPFSSPPYCLSAEPSGSSSSPATRTPEPPQKGAPKNRRPPPTASSSSESIPPLAQEGGLFGWGPNFKPIVLYESIDNQYLLVWNEQGALGLGSFLLLSLGTVLVLLRGVVYKRQTVDRALAFTLLGIFAGMLVTVATVFLGLQPAIVFFVVVGWAQALCPPPRRDPPPVFQQVYT